MKGKHYLIIALTILVGGASSYGIRSLNKEATRIKNIKLLEEVEHKTSGNNNESTENEKIEDKKVIPENALGKIQELFPDENLALHISNILDKDTWDYVTTEELSEIKDISIPVNETSSIVGIGYLTSIESFNNCKNDVVEIPVEIGNCKKLKSFDICKAYSLSKIPKELFDCTDITYMRMYMSGIDELPKEIGKLKKLEYLLCSQGTKLPKEIGQLQNLKELDCESTYIPKEVKELKKLEYLNINSSQVDEFIEYIGELKNLKRLDLGGCNLKDFPMGILQLEKLEYLNLFGNDIRKIPKEIGNLKKLESINTYDNYNLDEDYKQYLFKNQ